MQIAPTRIKRYGAVFCIRHVYFSGRFFSAFRVVEPTRERITVHFRVASDAGSGQIKFVAAALGISAVFNRGAALRIVNYRVTVVAVVSAATAYEQRGRYQQRTDERYYDYRP